MIYQRIWLARIRRIPNTLQLSAFAVLISTLLALPIGVLVALKKDTPIDFLGKLFALLGQSAPLYPIGLILMWVFANQIAPHDHRVGNLDDIKLPPWWIGESTVERRW